MARKSKAKIIDSSTGEEKEIKKPNILKELAEALSQGKKNVQSSEPPLKTYANKSESELQDLKENGNSFQKLGAERETERRAVAEQKAFDEEAERLKKEYEEEQKAKKATPIDDYMDQYKKGELTKEQLGDIIKEKYPNFSYTPTVYDENKAVAKEELEPVTELELPKTEEPKEEESKEELKAEEEPPKEEPDAGNPNDLSHEKYEGNHPMNTPDLSVEKAVEDAVQKKPKLIDTLDLEVDKAVDKAEEKARKEEERKAKEEERINRYNEFMSKAPTVFQAIFTNSGLTFGQKASLLGEILANTGVAIVNGKLQAYGKNPLPEITMKGPVYQSLMDAINQNSNRYQNIQNAKNKQEAEATEMRAALDARLGSMKENPNYETLRNESMSGTPVSEDRFTALGFSKDMYDTYKSSVNSARMMQENKNANIENDKKYAEVMQTYQSLDANSQKVIVGLNQTINSLNEQLLKLEEYKSWKGKAEILSKIRETFGGLNSTIKEEGSEAGEQNNESNSSTGGVSGSLNIGSDNGSTSQTTNAEGKTTTTTTKPNAGKVASLLSTIFGLGADITAHYDNTKVKGSSSHQNTREQFSKSYDEVLPLLQQADEKELDEALVKAVEDAENTIRQQIEAYKQAVIDEYGKQETYSNIQKASMNKAMNDGVVIPDGQVQWLQREDGSKVFLNPDDVVIAVKGITDKLNLGPVKTKDYDYYLKKLRRCK